MRSIFSVLAAGALISLASTQSTDPKKDVSISCLIYDDLSFYDLRTLQNHIDYTFNDTRIADDKYYFNLCAQTIVDCNAESTADS